MFELSVPSGHLMSLEEYLVALRESPLAAATEALLSNLAEYLEIYNKCHDDYGEPPVIRIRNEETPYAEGSGYSIQLSHGMVEHCLTTDPVGLEGLNIKPYALSFFSDPVFLARLMLFWIVLHEHIHGVRSHDAALQALGVTPEIERAVEFDADLCAVAFLYRHIQHRANQSAKVMPEMSVGHSDVGNRQLAISVTYWALRKLTSFCKRAIHSTIAERIIQMCVKLSTLCEMPSEQLPDNDLKKESTHVICGVLLETVVKLEEANLKANPSMEDFRQELAEASTSQSWREASMTWNQIRMDVASLVGGSMLENERRNAMRDFKSA